MQASLFPIQAVFIPSPFFIGDLMHRGFVKLFRKTIDSGIMRSAELSQLWMWCLIKATHKETSVVVGKQIVHIHPGQFVFGRKVAAESLGSTEKKIRNSMDALELMGNVGRERANKFTIVTIRNWELYQGQEHEEGPTKGQQRANKGPTKGHIQEQQEHKEEKNKDIVPEEAGRKFPFQEIISYLNQATGKNFKHNGQTTQRSIKARFKEGFSLQDFFTVIDNKVSGWINDPKMAQYLCPETLFGNKFDKYLNEVKPGPRRIEDIDPTARMTGADTVALIKEMQRRKNGSSDQEAPYLGNGTTGIDAPALALPGSGQISGGNGNVVR